MRGLITIAMYRELCKKLHVDETDFINRFDLICGTSTGGILVIGMGLLKFSPDEGVALYREIGSQVFGGPKDSKVQGIYKMLKGLYQIQPKYPNKLKEVFMSKLKPIPLFDKAPSKENKIPHLFVVSVDCSDQPGNVFLFRNYLPSKDSHVKGTDDKNPFTLVDAALATSAAPTYFEPFLAQGKEFVDGGMMENNPIKSALSEALEIWPKRKIACVLSLGTGKPSPKRGSMKNYGGLISTMVYIATDSERPVDDAKQMIAGWSHKPEIFRFNPPELGSDGLDEIDKFDEWNLSVRKYMIREFKKDEKKLKAFLGMK
jgi:patatin-like phospholipase/acyl hydrolase